jgi:hypothetical protein
MDTYYSYQAWQGRDTGLVYGCIYERSVDDQTIVNVLNFHCHGTAITQAPDVIISSIDDALELVRDLYGKTRIHYKNNDLNLGKRDDTVYYSISYHNDNGQQERRASTLERV